MCYYNGIKVSRQEFIRLKNMEKQLNQMILANTVTSGFDYGKVPVVKPDATYCDWNLVQMEWGFIPGNLRNREAVERFRKGWKDDNGNFSPPIITLNAKGEELLLPNKMYREAALKRRCLILSTGFVEWRHLPKIGKRGEPLKATEKYPYFIKAKGDEVFYFAGVWQTWTDQDTGEVVDTCALVTTQANSLMSQIHNSKLRMPCIMRGERAGKWISDGLSEREITALATAQFPSELMEAWTIDKDFMNKVDQAERVVYAGVPELVAA